MARIRSIYPGTPTDPELASNPVEGRLLAQTVATIPEKLYRKADRRAAMILDAKPWGSMKEVRDSAVTSVISEIWRRKYPTKCEPIPENISFIKVDLSLVPMPPLEAAGVDPTPCIMHKNFGSDEEPAWRRRGASVHRP